MTQPVHTTYIAIHMARTATHTHIIHIVPTLDRQLRRYARRENVTMTAVWRQALAEYLEREERRG